MSSSRLSKIKYLIPPLSSKFHKGLAGRIAVFGGCADYTGAPYFSAMSGALLGADLSHVICSKSAAVVIKSYSPDLMVHPYLLETSDISKNQDCEDYDIKNVIKSIMKNILPILERIHVLVIGPGLGRDRLLQETAAEVLRVARDKNLPLVVDADGLFLLQSKPELVKGYKEAILTPNVVEFKRLQNALKVGNNNDKNKEENNDEFDIKETIELAQTMEVTILRKGFKDIIATYSDKNSKSNKENYMIIDKQGGLKRCGGQGDVLSGCVATFFAWKKAYDDGLWEHNDNDKLTSDELRLLAAAGGSMVVKTASHKAFELKKRSMQATDVLDQIGASYEELF